MEPHTITGKDLSPHGPGGCVWEGDEEMDSVFICVLECLFIYWRRRKRRRRDPLPTGDTPLMGTQGKAALLLRVPAKLGLTLLLEALLPRLLGT